MGFPTEEEDHFLVTGKILGPGLSSGLSRLHYMTWWLDSMRVLERKSAASQLDYRNNLDKNIYRMFLTMDPIV